MDPGDTGVADRRSPTPLILAFTGTRKGMTPEQLETLEEVLGAFPLTILHGGAFGADTQFHSWLVANRYLSIGQIEIYPASEVSRRNWTREPSTVLVHPAQAPLVRNQVMVSRCTWLLAAPQEANEKRRSGTWATIRYARAAQKPITIICPDGSLKSD
jgi:hypothetical protein